MGSSESITRRASEISNQIIAISGGGRVGGKTYLNVSNGLGADCVFAKPLHLKDLSEAIRNLLY